MFFLIKIMTYDLLGKYFDFLNNHWFVVKIAIYICNIVDK